MLVKIKTDVCHILVVLECVCNRKIENQLSQIWKELDLNLNSKNMVQNQSGTICHRAEQRVWIKEKTQENTRCFPPAQLSERHPLFWVVGSKQQKRYECPWKKPNNRKQHSRQRRLTARSAFASCPTCRCWRGPWTWPVTGSMQMLTRCWVDTFLWLGEFPEKMRW